MTRKKHKRTTVRLDSERGPIDVVLTERTTCCICGTRIQSLQQWKDAKPVVAGDENAFVLCCSQHIRDDHASTAHKMAVALVAKMKAQGVV